MDGKTKIVSMQTRMVARRGHLYVVLAQRRRRACPVDFWGTRGPCSDLRLLAWRVRNYVPRWESPSLETLSVQRQPDHFPLTPTSISQQTIKDSAQRLDGLSLFLKKGDIIFRAASFSTTQKKRRGQILGEIILGPSLLSVQHGG